MQEQVKSNGDTFALGPKAGTLPVQRCQLPGWLLIWQKCHRTDGQMEEKDSPKDRAAHCCRNNNWFFQAGFFKPHPSHLLTDFTKDLICALTDKASAREIEAVLP